MARRMESTMGDPKQVLRKYINEELQTDDEAEISDDANLLTGGMVDSLGVLKLVSFIEHEFEMEVADEEVTVDNFRSLKDIGDYLERKKQGKT